MRDVKALAVPVLMCVGFTVGALARQESDSSKPKVPLVSVVGCANRTPDGVWTLTNATDGTETKTLFSSTAEVEEAKKKKSGTNRYRLVGTADFLTKEELLKEQQRAAFTRPEVANATGQLQHGRKVVVKGLLITVANEKRLNLVSVLQLGDTCK